jgi:hypothetical protein
MRVSVPYLLLALLALAGAFPRHRCTPAGSDRPGTTVFVGAHAHDGPCDHDHGDEPCDDDGVPCCTHAPGDPTAPPSELGFDVAPPTTTRVEVVDAARAASSAPARASWHAPVPRPPTETVVLLR